MSNKYATLTLKIKTISNNFFQIYQMAGLLRLALLAFAFTFLAKISLDHFSLYSGNVSVIWPSSGMALAVLIIAGKKYWPGVFIGSMLSGLLVGDAATVSASIAMGNTLEAVFGCWLLSNSKKFNSKLQRPLDFAMLSLAGSVCALVSAIIGISTLWIAGIVPQSAVGQALLNWWQGDTLGIILLSPFILIWKTLPSNWLSRDRLIEAGLCFGLLLLFGQVVFLGWFENSLGLVARGFWIFLFISWAAIRFGNHGVTLIIAITGIQSLLGVVQGTGFFATDFEQTHMTNFLVYMLTLSVVGMTISSAISVRENTERLLRRSETTLKDAQQLARLGNWHWDKRSDTHIWSEEVFRIYGRDPALPPATYPEVSQYFTNESWAQLSIAVEISLAKGQSYECDAEVVRPNGVHCWITARGEAIRDISGEIIYLYGTVQDITERKMAEQLLATSEREFRLLAESMPQIVWITQADGKNIYFNQLWVNYTGLTLEESYGHGWSKPFHYDDQQRAITAWQDALNNNTSYSLECQLRRADGIYRWWLIRGVPVFDESGCVLKWFGTCTDIHDIKMAEQELRISAIAFESQEAIIVTDENQVILKVNHAFTNITGYSFEEAIGKTPSIIKSGRQNAMFHQSMWESLSHNHYWQGEVWDKRKNGEEFPVWQSITAVLDETGKTKNYVATFLDLSQDKKAEEAIRNLSLYDPLTGLANRQFLLQRLKQTILLSAKENSQVAILYIDLDDFKSLNDTRGHDIGDLLLIEVSKRIQNCVHPDDIVARVGSDEYVVVLEALSIEADQAAKQAEAIAERIRDIIKQPFELRGHEYLCKASIGINLFRDHETTVEDLLMHADAAMFQAKQTGRDKVQFFDPSMQAALEERVLLESELHKAIPNQLKLYYQIQVKSNGQISGAEALIRWQHPNIGIISPTTFIPLAEDTGLILPIGHWVLETACLQLKAWQDNISTRDLVIAVNVSAKQFQQPDFATQVLEVLTQTGADPTRLKLELTESLFVQNIETIIAKMNVLKAKGIRFSLDDFGTGFSSLSYLKRLPLDQLKIDQSFVRDILSDPNDAAIVRTIIALGHSLGLAVIAEGVETEEQRNFLAVNGCQNYQGYLFSKPVPVSDFEKLLKLEGVRNFVMEKADFT